MWACPTDIRWVLTLVINFDKLHADLHAFAPKRVAHFGTLTSLFSVVDLDSDPVDAYVGQKLENGIFCSQFGDVQSFNDPT